MKEYKDPKAQCVDFVAEITWQKIAELTDNVRG